MSRSQRDKGARIERGIVKMLLAAGIKAERVPLSGAQLYQGNGHDVDIYARGPEAPPLVSQIKGSAPRYVWWRTIEKDLADADALILKEDRKEPLVVLPWRVAMEFLKP